MSGKWAPLWRGAHFEDKSVKNWRSRTTFGSWDVEKVHAVVAQSTFLSQNVQATPGWEHFLKLACQKSARRCGAKHMSKSKVEKLRGRSIFGRKDVVLRGRHKGFCTLPKVSKTWRFCSSFNYAPLHYTQLHYTTLHCSYNCNYHYNYNYTTLHDTTLITLHYITPHPTTLNYTTLQ